MATIPVHRVAATPRSNEQQISRGAENGTPNNVSASGWGVQCRTVLSGSLAIGTTFCRLLERQDWLSMNRR